METTPGLLLLASFPLLLFSLQLCACAPIHNPFQTHIQSSGSLNILANMLYSTLFYFGILCTLLKLQKIEARPQISLNDLIDSNSNVFLLERKDPNFGEYSL